MKTTVRIIGLGNPLMGDDGLGIRAIQQLQKEKLPESLDIIDGGCGGLNLLPLFTDCQHLIIIDAADFGAEAGQLKILSNCDLSCLPPVHRQQNGHLFGLAEILRIAQQLNQLPALTLYLLQVKSCQPNTGLSPDVALALPHVIKLITSAVINN